MTSLPTLSTHLQTLTDHNRALQALIHRLSKLNFGSTSDEGRVRLELTAEISENLKSLEGELELLKEEVEGFTAGGRGNGGGGLGQFGHARRESEKETERIRVLVGVRKLGEDLRL
jgi:protein transport protein SEC20